MKYQVIECKLGFGTAFEKMKNATNNNLGMRLPQWKEDVVIRIQRPTELSKMTAPYLYVESRFGMVPWKETMIELFSDEWTLVNIIDYDPEEEENKKEFPNEECSDRCLKGCVGECKNAK